MNETSSVNKNFDEKPMSVGEWLITIIVLAIPVINIIFYLYWAFTSSGNLNRRNYCRAALIIVVIFLGIFVLFALFGGLAAILSNWENFGRANEVIKM
jgi:hypothetical protein